ncbi:AP2-like ethylene-responsive transcription factor AIL5 [Hordeum vulgare]|nr:AP2-like ethylene-responsive transcription factor AIL5 [Hordeum vulgare]
MMKSEEEVSQGQQMDDFVKEKAARESGDGRKIKTSPSINLNYLPTMAPAPVDIVVLHGAMESGANDAESSGTDKKKLPKNEEVDEGKIQAHADMKSDSVDPLNNENHAGEKDALVIPQPLYASAKRSQTSKLDMMHQVKKLGFIPACCNLQL